MTAVEEIRRAAALMRERAQAATPGPSWRRNSMVVQVRPIDPPTDSNRVRSGDKNIALVGTVADATHIASWHPAVALAVADGLDEDADELESAYADGFDNAWLYGKTLAVARAYLGGEQP
jgi:hypothetical protein